MLVETFLSGRGALYRRLLSHGPGRFLRSGAIQKREKAYVARDCPFDPDRFLELKRKGIALTDVGSLPLAGNLPLADLQARAAALEDPAVLEPEDILGVCPEVYFLGLSPGMLDLAENYIAQYCRYAGCALKREKVGAPQVGARMWHRDVEDEHMLRVLIYLTDVDQGDGGFEYLVPGTWDLPGVGGGYIADEKLGDLVPGAQRSACVGPAGTAVLFDGSTLMHRAGSPSRRDRLSLAFTYTSRHPLQIHSCSRLKAKTRQSVLERLDARARLCLV